MQPGRATGKTSPFPGWRLAHALVAVLLLTVVATPAALAAETRVAVAANFTEAARAIGAAFHESTGHRAVFSFGATGQLFAQITHDAPFEVFLAADQERPRRAVEDGFALPGTRFTYATGRLVLFSRDPGRVTGPDTLRDDDFTRLAIANPITAPYGAAAMQVLDALDIRALVSPRIVQGNNIAQTNQFVATGNAELGFIALSQVIRHDAGSRWVVPESLHDPIAQDAVLLRRGEGSVAARAFLDFLRGGHAGRMKQAFGYGPGD